MDERRVKGFMTTVVISQPMFFPWSGMLEQVKLSNSFVFYDDVQYTRGFFNRVQIKTASGRNWITVPLQDWHQGQLINEVKIDNRIKWKQSHIGLLKQAYADAPFRKEMIDIVEDIFIRNYVTLDELAIASCMALIKYFRLDNERQFYKSSELNIPGVSTQRLVDICRSLGAKTYLTGHGAKNYLEHECFEKVSIQVKYIDYGLKQYPQMNGSFIPYVSSLDLIANCGFEGLSILTGQLIAWQEFIARQC